MKKMNKGKIEIIVCPRCGREYLPAEIYIPDSFLGKPEDIQKTRDGKIDSFFGKTMDLKESFECDDCGTKFNVSARVSFRTTIDEKSDFDSDYTTPLYENRIYMNEDLSA